MNVLCYKNFILSHFKSLEHNKTLLCRDRLFISSVEVDYELSFLFIFCAKKRRKKIEVDLHNFVHFCSSVGSEETARTLKREK